MYRKHNKFARWQPRFEAVESYERFRYDSWWATYTNTKPKTRRLKFVKPFGGVRSLTTAPKWHMFWHRQEHIRASGLNV